MRLIKNNIFLIIIVTLALVIRFANLTDFRCLNWDEASFAYNSYSILKTGKDEYGVLYPLQFKSIGDYKNPLYIYLTVPIIAVLGLNNYAIRFVPALLGALAAFVIFKIVYLLFNNKNIALISAFFVAISPWHIQFTKGGADVGVSTFFVTVTILGLVAILRNKNWGYIAFPIGASLALYSYFSDRIFIPVFIILFILFFRKNVLNNVYRFLKSLFSFTLLSMPLIPVFISSGHLEKFLKTTIFGYSRPIDYVSSLKLTDNMFIYTTFHSSFVESSLGVIHRYLNHFSPTFLFFEGAIEDPRQFIFKMGVLYLFDLPLIILGIRFLLKQKDKLPKILLAIWIIASPLPAAITKDSFHARRSYNLMYPLLIISTLGLYSLIEKVNSFGKNIKLFGYFLIVSIIIYFFAFYQLSYYILTPPRTKAGPAGWHCGYKELVEYIEPIKDKYKKIVIDNYYQGPYIFFLLYSKYPPEKYQTQANLFQESQFTLGESLGYDNYEFRSTYWPKDRCETGYLFAGPPHSLPEKDIKPGEARIIEEIKYFDGETAFRIVEVLEPSELTCPR